MIKQIVVLLAGCVIIVQSKRNRINTANILLASKPPEEE